MTIALLFIILALNIHFFTQWTTNVTSNQSTHDSNSCILFIIKRGISGKTGFKQVSFNYGNDRFRNTSFFIQSDYSKRGPKHTHTPLWGEKKTQRGISQQSYDGTSHSSGFRKVKHAALKGGSRFGKMIIWRLVNSCLKL